LRRLIGALLTIEASLLNVDHPKEHKSRLGGHSYFYCDIAEREFSRSIEIGMQYESEEDEQTQSNLEDKYAVAGVKSIIFSALSVEAAINDYAAWQLGDNYFVKHLSSLDVASKWVVIPKLVCGKSIDKSGPGFSALKKLISARNDLVHNKSTHLDLSDPNLAVKLEKRSNSFDENIANSYRAVVLLSLTMDRLVGNHYNPLRTFDKEASLISIIPDNIVGVINDCRTIISRNRS
jgi:hypothetical protein